MRHAVRQCLSFLARVVWLSVAAFYVSEALAVPAPAGKDISNVASVTYRNFLGLVAAANSNTVVVQVQAVYSSDLTPGYVHIVEPGSAVSWVHQLTNRGNAPDTFNLTLSDLGGDDGQISGLSLFVDANGNCKHDSGDLPLTPAQGVTIQPGASVCLFVEGGAPVNALAGQHFLAGLTAVGAQSGTLPAATDEIRIVANSLVLTKGVDKTQVSAGDTLTYTVQTLNASDIPVTPTQTSVDGASLLKVVVDDPLPVGATLLAVPIYSGPGKLIYHLQSAAAGAFVTVAPADLTQVDHIGVVYDAFAASASDTWKFSVTAGASTAGTFIQNQFQAFYRNGGIERSALSNRVYSKIDGAVTLVNKDSGYANLSLRIGLGDDLYLEARCSTCNTDPAVNDFLVIKVTSGNNPTVTNFKGHDEEIVTLRETGPNTGVFHVVAFGVDTSKTQPIGIPTRDGFLYPVQSGNQIIETVKHDRLVATILYCLKQDGTQGAPVNVTADVLVDPYGVLFDTTTNKPVSNAIVTLLDLATCTDPSRPVTCSDAKVYQDDLGTIPAPATITTGLDGSYRFPFVPAGNYVLSIKAPSNYTFPSAMSPSQVAAAWSNRVIVTGSYGDKFALIPALGPVEIDVPLDPFVPNMQLFVEKKGNRTTAEIGDFVDYTLSVKNAGTLTAHSVEGVDIVPLGFNYVPGTAFVDGIPRDPDHVVGRELHFSLNTLAPGDTHTLTYRLRIGPNALQGDGINRATAFENLPGGGKANQAVYKVKVTPGIFTSDAYITGKIYTDCNRNGVQDPEEVGVPGVRFYLEDGTMVVSDIEGKYNLYGLRPKTHVLKLDRTTLPKDIELIEQGVRSGGDPGSRFVDLKAGELHRADFAVTSGTGACDGPGMEEIYQRRANGEAPLGELERALKADLPVNPITVGDIRALPASGCMAGGDQKCGVHGKADLPVLAESLLKRRFEAEIDPATGKPKQDNPEERLLESYLSGADYQLTFLNLKDEQILPVAQTTIMVKGRLGADIRLSVNGEQIGPTRVGKKITVQDTQVEGREYIGVNLEPGKNVLELKQLDAAGNNRGSVKITVIAPGPLHNLMLEAGAQNLEANGSNEVPLVLELTDKDGVPVTVRTEVTIETNAGRIRDADVNPVEPGTQLFVEGGEAHLTLVAPTEAAVATVVARSGLIRHETKVKFVPELRPMIASGLVEGMINLKNFDTSRVTPAMASDGFEEELHTLASSNDGKLNAGGRAAFFLKGKVKGEYLLTMAYDSDKHSDQTLFRDIRPEDYYPVYGDSAVRGFDAQSTSKLYVRVDKGRSNVLYGDYNTRIDNMRGVELGQFSRSLTGVKTHIEKENQTVNAFAAQTQATQVIQEIPALGVSGPYTIPGVDGLQVNSEKIEILLRDRNNPGVILSVTPQSRFIDYEFEPLSASLIFKAPVPSLDANLNPYSIRITAEVNNGGPAYWVGGVQADRKLNDRLNIGGMAVLEDNPASRYNIGSVNAVYKIAADTTLVTEFAQSDRDVTGVGQAGRIVIEHSNGNTSWRLYHGQSTTTFDNVSSTLSAGRAESTAKFQTSIVNVGTVRSEAIRSEDIASGNMRQGVTASLEHRFGKVLGVEVGGRYYQTSSTAGASLGAAPYDGTTARLRLNVKPPQIEGASAFVQYEQDVRDPERKVVSAGADYRIGTQGRIYANHEFISSLHGTYGLTDQQQTNSTVVGVEDQYMKDGKVFSEYRVRDSINTSDTEAAIGLRNNWHLSQATRMTTNFERINTLKGLGTNDATAVSLGVEYLPSPLWKATGKIDLRWADNADSILNQLGLAWKLNRDWTMLTRNTFNLTNNHNTGDRLLDRFQTGFAWRQVDSNRWDALTKLEFRIEDDQSNPASPIDRKSYIVSQHLNYHPLNRLTLSGHYAGKLARDYSSFLSGDSRTHMLGGRVIVDLSERWESSIQTGRIWGDTGQSRYVAGIETGYMIVANFWLSGGFNFLSYKDADLVGNDYTAQGFYIRFRFKFDEDLFNGAKPAINKTLEPEHVSP